MSLLSKNCLSLRIVFLSLLASFKEKIKCIYRVYIRSVAAFSNIKNIVYSFKQIRILSSNLLFYTLAMIIVWITGTLGAGKWTVVEYLVEKKWFQHFSVRAFLIQEIEKRGLPVNRDSMVLVANDLRAKYGPAYIIQQLYQQAKISWKNTIIESIRAVGEVKALQDKENFYLFAVDANPKTRYERIVLRGSETDKVSYEEFISNEQREMNNTDPTKQNIGECMQLADHHFDNNWTFEELYAQIESVIKKYLF